MQNLEVKAIFTPEKDTWESLEKIGAAEQWTRIQKDTYFYNPTGKLKLRQVSNLPAELIYYERAASRIKHSVYSIYRTDDPESLLEFMRNMLGIDRIVSKTRTFYLWENVRIHFDTVEQLGSFLELEAVLDDSGSAELSRQRLEFLCSRLNVTDFINVGYYELLKSREADA